jgi:hypothetical protein
VEAKKAEPRDSRTPSVIGGNAGMGRGMAGGMAAMQSPYAPGKSCCRYEPETDFHILVWGGGWINIWGGCCCLLWPGPGGNARKVQGKSLTKFAKRCWEGPPPPTPPENLCLI